MTDQTDNVDRRTVLLGAGTAAAAGVVAAFGTSAAQAQGRVDQECMTIVYQNGPDVRFNFDYYVNTHMPLIMRLYGKSISRFELRRGQPGRRRRCAAVRRDDLDLDRRRRRVRRSAAGTSGRPARRRAEIHERRAHRAARSHRRHRFLVKVPVTVRLNREPV